MNLTNMIFSLVGTQAAAAPESAKAAVKLADRSIADGTLAWGDAFQFLAVGLVIVFVALGALWGVCELMGLVFRSIDEKNARKAKEQAPAALKPAAASPAVIPAAISSEPVPEAVFVAAAAAMMGDTPHRVVSVQRLNDDGSLAVPDDVPIAVIAAAVAEALGGVPHRILSVRPVDMSWAREGRSQQLGAAIHR